ncbi:hypothetical protein [Larkinella soli]|uniref:hypothetical protein n=1 Tax=Larkinella soli TaxID=1770527 RepID=UPI000FFBBD99|nr:hypothetical protein [Larkinella soli]
MDLLKSFPQFDDISDALYRRESIDKRTGERYSILRLEKKRYCVLPSDAARSLEGEGFYIAVR